MALDSVMKLVVQHASAITPAQAKIEKAKREQEIVHAMFTSIIRGMIILGIGLVILVLNQNFELGRWIGHVTALLVPLSSFLMLSGIGWAVFGVLNSIRQGIALYGMKARDSLPSPDVKRLPTNPIPQAVPSITEHTTQLLPRDHSDPRARDSQELNRV